MEVPKQKYQRKSSLRLKGYDYSTEGMYFVTLVCAGRKSFFGSIANDKIELSKEGLIAMQEWKKSEQIRKEIVLGEFVVMPDHFHALVLIDNQIVKAHGHAPQTIKPYKNEFGPQSKNLSAFIRSFKAVCTKRIRQFNPDFGWQRSFHDRIVRDQKELERIEDYILTNPLKETLRSIAREKNFNKGRLHV